MQKHETLGLARELLTELLRPTAVSNGISLKAMPDDMSAVTRTAMMIPLVNGLSLLSSTTSAQTSDKQVGNVSVDCYVLVLAASQIGPKGAEWCCGLVAEALDGVRTGPGTAWPELTPSQVLVKDISFTSFKDQVWQYRVQVDLVLPYSSDNLSAKQDLAVQNKRNTITW